MTENTLIKHDIIEIDNNIVILKTGDHLRDDL